MPDLVEYPPEKPVRWFADGDHSEIQAHMCESDYTDDYAIPAPRDPFTIDMFEKP